MKSLIQRWISEIVDEHYSGQLTTAQVYKRIGDCYVHSASHSCDDVTEWVITHNGQWIGHAFDMSLAKQLFGQVCGKAELCRVDSRGHCHIEMIRH